MTTAMTMTMMTVTPTAHAVITIIIVSTQQLSPEYYAFGYTIVG